MSNSNEPAIMPYCVVNISLPPDCTSFFTVAYGDFYFCFFGGKCDKKNNVMWLA